MSSGKPYKLDQVGIRMVKEPPLYSAEPVNSPRVAVRLMSETLKGYDREVLAVVNLRNDLKPINMNIVSIGTLNQSLAHPREILKSIILSNAGSVMLFHNHPSGNLTQSPEDVSLTDRMAKICELLGTPIVDHIIIGNDDRYYSFRENSILKVSALEYARDVSDLRLGAESVSEPAGKNQTVEEITDKLDQFGYDFGPYGYMDAIGTREEGFAQIREELHKGKLSGYREYLQEVVAEESEFATEAKDFLDLMDRYENRGKLTREEKQSILDRIEELSKQKPALPKDRLVPVKEEAR